MSTSSEIWQMENGNVKVLSREKHGRTAHNMSASSLRKKSDIDLASKVHCSVLKKFLANIQEVSFGTKLCVLLPAVPLAIFAQCYGFARAWVFGLSMLGLTLLAERISFLTEQIAFYTGPTGTPPLSFLTKKYFWEILYGTTVVLAFPFGAITFLAPTGVGGLLNATCGNATELIIAIFALCQHKVDVVKYSLLGSILSNLLLVLGTSLLCGGLVNLRKEQNYDRKQADVNSMLLLLALLCHILPLMFRYAGGTAAYSPQAALQLSRASSIIMLIAYVAYIFFQLCTHRKLYAAQEEEQDDDFVCSEETPVVGFWSGVVWLVGMTILVALLSEYVVGTIEEASASWGISVTFISIILLPIVGNAAEHAGAVIFAFKNKLDITLGVALGSATQIALFVVPASVLFGWILGIDMDLDFNLLETGSLALSIIVTAFTLQDGTSHYMKGLILLLCYIVIGACFFVSSRTTTDHQQNKIDLGLRSSTRGISRV